MMVVSLLLVLGVSIGVSASTNYDRQEVDACITISERLSVKGGSKSVDVNGKLIDGSSMKTDDVLDLASDFLGEGYTEPVPGSGRYVSADGTRVFRMGENDILGRHGGGPHVNFEFLEPNPSKPGKMQVVKDIHIYLED